MKDCCIKTKQETARKIFDWLDIELFKKNRIFVGEGQNVLAEGENRFLSDRGQSANKKVNK